MIITASLVWLSATLQRNVAQTRGERLEAVDQLLLATLREEFQLHTDAEHGLDERVRDALEARGDYRDAIDEVRAESEGVGEVTEAIEAFTSLHDRWEKLAERSVSGEVPGDVVDQRASLVTAMERATLHLRTVVASEQDEDQAGLTLLLIGLSAGLFLVVGGTVSVLAGRRERERSATELGRTDYAATQSEFAETLQLLGEEQEAHQLVKRHLERTLPAASATILSRNNSANRLEATTEPLSETEVAKRLAEGVEPRACLATRLGELQERKPDEVPLLPCDLCGAEPGATTCAPLLVSGEVIGAVLVQHEQPFGARDRHRVTESVSHASPVIGNLRNLALAETRAATDALTGLPNRRALQDTVRRMVAQAGRSLEPLAVLALDLDHFKQINDRFGHEKGDDVLAAVGPCSPTACGRATSSRAPAARSSASCCRTPTRSAPARWPRSSASRSHGSRSPASSARSPAASASPSTRSRRSTLRRSCARPTARCTWPRSTGATASSSRPRPRSRPPSPAATRGWPPTARSTR